MYSYKGRGYPSSFPLITTPSGGGGGAPTPVVFADSPNLDAFGRLRVSNPLTLFDAKQLADGQPLLFDDVQVSGAGTSSTYNAGQASTTLAVSNLTAGHRVKQTRRRFPYQPGKSQLVDMTGVIGVPTAGITRRIGFFDESNGIYLGSTPNGLFVAIRSSASGLPVDNIIQQADWNIDPLNGTGPSGITLDPSTTQIFFTDFEWLGVGRVRVGFNIGGISYYCHEFLHANILPVVYMSTPNLPVRYEIINDGTGPAASLVQICCSVITEGGRSETGISFGINRDLNTIVVSNSNVYSAIGIRLKTTHLGALIRILDASLICTSSAEYAWYIILNPTVVGAAFVWTPLSNSSVEFSFGTNATTLTGGTILQTGLRSDTNTIRAGSVGLTGGEVSLGSTISGIPDEIFFAFRRLTGGNETFYASLNILDAN